MDTLANELEIKHKALGLTYPRPQITCPECQGKLVLRCGEKNRPHFAHKVKQSVKCHIGESFEHHMGKKLLCDYLNTGGKVILTSGRILPSCINWREEVTCGQFRFDIAGFNEQKVVSFDIEVFWKHRAENAQSRTVEWAEVKAEEILVKLLLVDELPDCITLTDLRPQVVIQPPTLVSQTVKLSQASTFIPYAI